MKRIILLLISVACYISSYAQDIELASFPNNWYICQFSEQYYSYPEYEYEKPIIDHVIFEWDIINEKEYCWAINTQGTISAFLREEEGKVYTYIEKDNAEYLFYNFAALEGDEFDIYVNEDNKQCHCMVTKVDSVVIDNYKLKRITFNVKGDTFAEKEEEWIEKVGRMGDPVYNVYLSPSTSPRPFLMCYTNVLHTLYFSQPINEKHFKGQMVQDATLFTHSVDRAYGQTIKADAHFEGDTLCFSGTVCVEPAGPYYVTCTDDKDHNIDISVYDYGMFIAMYNGWKINFRIPGYADGVYKITDLDGTHEVVCGDIPEGIKPVVKEADTDSYDIQGRKQNDNARGIIIKDNRKVLKQ